MRLFTAGSVHSTGDLERAAHHLRLQQPAAAVRFGPRGEAGAGHGHARGEGSDGHESTPGHAAAAGVGIFLRSNGANGDDGEGRARARLVAVLALLALTRCILKAGSVVGGECGCHVCACCVLVATNCKFILSTT